MEIKGTEQEMKRLFKERNTGIFGTKKSNNKPFKSYFKNLSKKQLTLLVTVSVITVLVFVNLMVLSVIFDYGDDYVTKSECTQKMIAQTSYVLAQDITTWEKILFVYATPIKFLLIAIAIAWILHGVGFKIIGN